jgi:hypothetical protein
LKVRENAAAKNGFSMQVWFRAAHVFDSQTDGEALPEFATVKGDSQNYSERLKQFVVNQ